ncbi:MAG: sterol desaturase family protein [Bacteroidetes bacterium]|nr:sterol desaturase family protein [Bacteroidota bacterium]
MTVITKPRPGRIFKNEFLESLTKSSPRISISFYTLIIFFFVYLSHQFTSLNIVQASCFYVAGIVLWTLIEYFLHRYVFHIDEYFPVLKRFHYIFHGVHHENPRDHDRLFMPVIAGTIIASFLTAVFYFFFGRHAFPLMAGISSGYVVYAYIHYTIHTRPGKLYFHQLWINHLKHHYKHPDKAFGVSSPFWDIVFKTTPPENSGETRHFS